LKKLNILLNDLNIPVTIHGDLGMPIQNVEKILQALNGKVACFSLDPRCRIDPNGAFFSLEKHMPILEWLVDVHAEYGIEFCIEDFPLSEQAFNTNKSELKNILSCPAFGILLDIGHMNLRIIDDSYNFGNDYSEYIKKIPVPIKEIHLHDNPGDGDKHMPIGHGNINFKNVISALKTKQFDNFCTVEVTPRLYGRKSEEEIENAISSMVKFKSLWNT
jgi:sugar phosphate isomerase/epimerase